MDVETFLEIDADHRRYLVGEEPMLFHCHHYNTFLQRSIQDATYIPSTPFLVGAAASVAHAQFSFLFQEFALVDVEPRKQLAMFLYRWAGFGTIDLWPLTQSGGSTSTQDSHYSMAWKENFGLSPIPICYFASGWIAGALAAIYEQPNGTFHVQEMHCHAMASEDCLFAVTMVKTPAYTLYPSVGIGNISAHALQRIPPNPIDYEGVYDALTAVDISGDEHGVIPRFGVYLTRMYANYYNRISYEFEKLIIDKFGDEGRKIAASLFIEAGHVCSFHTFGGIMTSPEWDALIRPNLVTQEDWVHGIVAAINALGWGRWQVTEISSHQSIFVIHDDYESSGSLAMYGNAHHPSSYLAEGAAVGVMNLVYHGNVASKPTLTSEYYNFLFKNPSSFHAESLSSKAMGDEYTCFRVFRD